MKVRDKINEVAAALARANGWTFPDGMDFSEAENPRVRQYWGCAVVAYEAFFGDAPVLNASFRKGSRS